MLKSMVGVLACAGVFAAEAQVGDKLEAQSIISSGLSRPLAVVQPEGDARLFIVEQRSSTTGRIRVYKNGAMLTTPYLSISPVSTGKIMHVVVACAYRRPAASTSRPSAMPTRRETLITLPSARTGPTPS